MHHFCTENPLESHGLQVLQISKLMIQLSGWFRPKADLPQVAIICIVHPLRAKTPKCGCKFKPNLICKQNDNLFVVLNFCHSYFRFNTPTAYVYIFRRRYQSRPPRIVRHGICTARKCFANSSQCVNQSRRGNPKVGQRARGPQVECYSRPCPRAVRSKVRLLFKSLDGSVGRHHLSGHGSTQQ